VERALALGPDLIVSDVMMPRLSGDEMVRELRASGELDDVPILMLTAKADDDLRVRLLREGAQDYLMKPFAADELCARVGNLVTLKRVRDLLQRELASQRRDLEGLAQEVTGRKRDLEMALDAMRVARDQAEQASKTKSTFLSLVSHELRTPLTALQTYLHALGRQHGDTLSPEPRRIVRRMASASRRLSQLVESLLEKTRIESGRLTTRIEDVDLVALAQTVVDDAQAEAEQKALAVQVSAARALPPLVSDRRLVRLILGNLVGNAIKFTERGVVEVILAHRDGAHRIAVRDTGSGIPVERRAAIFEPFEQLESTPHKHAPGVGLGLALVQAMVEALGGSIELDSKVGVGSTFTVVLPAAAEQATRVSA